MDLFNKFASQAINKDEQHAPQQQQQSGGANDLLGKLGGIVASQNKPQQQQEGHSSSGGNPLLDKLHGAVGGGPESEKKEDALDKGIDWVQEKLLKEGSQTNESAAEQAKDNLIAGSIRDGYKKATGKDFPIKEKEPEKKSGVAGLASSFGF